ncbi:hypothetical protein P167DRAFT_394578 [Morchella conica CCBAS932]|uniref:Uncharacterized protein n=1 Tax=Morchella conica CCBAS932 TaxID=1392247 RepID=A0A3N4KH44_9PEZI|nr:hypothetical protein P167DRAFT_394578 [Morchella conica CCBAS932]
MCSVRDRVQRGTGARAQSADAPRGVLAFYLVSMIVSTSQAEVLSCGGIREQRM